MTHAGIFLGCYWFNPTVKKHRYNLNLTCSGSLTTGCNSPSHLRNEQVNITEFHHPKKSGKTRGKQLLLSRIQLPTVLVLLESDILCPQHRVIYMPKTCTILRWECLHQVSSEASTTVERTKVSKSVIPVPWLFLPLCVTEYLTCSHS